MKTTKKSKGTTINGKKVSQPFERLSFLNALEKPNKNTNATGTSIKIMDVKYFIGNVGGNSERSLARPNIRRSNKTKIINTAGIAY
jgi:hypothetical protein